MSSSNSTAVATPAAKRFNVVVQKRSTDLQEAAQTFVVETLDYFLNEKDALGVEGTKKADEREKQRRLQGFVECVQDVLDKRFGAYWHVVCGNKLGFATTFRKGTLGMFSIFDTALVGSGTDSAKEKEKMRAGALLVLVYKSAPRNRVSEYNGGIMRTPNPMSQGAGDAKKFSNKVRCLESSNNTTGSGDTNSLTQSEDEMKFRATATGFFESAFDVDNTDVADVAKGLRYRLTELAWGEAESADELVHVYVGARFAAAVATDAKGYLKIQAGANASALSSGNADRTLTAVCHAHSGLAEDPQFKPLAAAKEFMFQKEGFWKRLPYFCLMVFVLTFWARRSQCAAAVESQGAARRIASGGYNTAELRALQYTSTMKDEKVALGLAHDLDVSEDAVVEDVKTSVGNETVDAATREQQEEQEGIAAHNADAPEVTEQKYEFDESIEGTMSGWVLNRACSDEAEKFMNSAGGATLLSLVFRHIFGMVGNKVKNQAGKAKRA